MSELQTRSAAATLDGSAVQAGVDTEAILKSIRQPLSQLLPTEPISAFVFCRLAGFNRTEPRIQPESFAAERLHRYTDFPNASPITVPEGVLIDDLDEYLAQQGKQKGDEFHLFAFAIANPKYRLPPVVAWCPWAKIKDKKGKPVFVPYHLLENTSLPIYLPCLTGTPESRDLRFHKLNEKQDPTIPEKWNSAVSIIVTDLE